MIRLVAGRYELDTLIGTGGNASVYVATDRVLHRRVAVKLVSADEVRQRDPAGRERFIAEARTSAEFLHPNAVTVFDAGEHDGFLYLVMELVDGGTLADRIARDGALEPGEAARIAADVLHALGAAHARGVIHRDVKPANILLAPNGQAKLADFGIAKRLDSIASGLTSHGQVFGTPKYLSPEQIEGRPPSPATDIYAVGIVLYEMLAGVPPFDGDDALAIALAHRDRPPPDLGQSRSDLSPAIVAVVATALRKDPAQRFPSAASMSDALASCVRSGDPTLLLPHGIGGPAGLPRSHGRRDVGIVTAVRRRRRAFGASVAIVASLLLAGVAFATTRSGDDSAAATTSAVATLSPPALTTVVTPPESTTVSTTLPVSTTTVAPSSSTSTTTSTTTAPTTTLAPPTTLPTPTDLPSLLAHVVANPQLAGARQSELEDALRTIDDRNGKKRRDAIGRLLDDVEQWVEEDEIDPALALVIVQVLDPDRDEDD